MRPPSWLPLLLSLQPATPALLPRADPVNDWVTIDPSGSPHTLTPSVTTSSGAVRTLSGAPYLLTGSVFTLSSDAALTTSTGSPPPPEASATDGAGGLFAVCHNRVGKDGPFCEPRAGSDLSIGRTYYVTWDGTFFGEDTRDKLVNITANYLPSGRRIMNAVPVPAGQGYLPLPIRESFLLGQEVQKPVRLTMAYRDDDGDLKEIPGPRVNILRAEIAVLETEKNSRTGPHPAAVAVPVVVGLLLLGLGAWWLWRRNRDRLILSGIRRRSGQGYGVGKSRAARAAKEGIDLKESPVSPPPRVGGNVFREEIERQDAGR